MRGGLRKLLTDALARPESGVKVIPAEETSGITRRRFLAAASGACIASLSWDSEANAAASMPKRRLGAHAKVAVIGAGIAGLNAAYRLAERGILADIFEASARAGGRMRTKRGVCQAGALTELGGELINTDHTEMLALCAAFGLHPVNRHKRAARFAAPKEAFLRAGGAVPVRDVSAALTRIAARIARDAKAVDDGDDALFRRLDVMSAAAYLDKYAPLIGSDYARLLLEQSVRSEYGSEPEATTALALIYNLPTVQGEQVEILGYSDETYAPAEGSSALTDALAAKAGRRLHLKRPLTRLSLEGGRYRLAFGDHAESLLYDYVIIAVPFPVLQRVELEIPLPETMRRFIRECGLGRNEKLFVPYRKAFWREGLFGESCMWEGDVSQIWDPHLRQSGLPGGTLNLFYGGAQTRKARREGAEAAKIRELRLLAKADPRFLSEAAEGAALTDWAGNPFSLGAYSTFAPGQLSQFRQHFWAKDEKGKATGPRFGNVLFAGEHVSDAFFGFMNGAAETGAFCAQEVARSVTRRRMTLGG